MKRKEAEHAIANVQDVFAGYTGVSGRAMCTILNLFEQQEWNDAQKNPPDNRRDVLLITESDHDGIKVRNSVQISFFDTKETGKWKNINDNHIPVIWREIPTPLED